MVKSGVYVKNKDEMNIIEFMEHYYSLGFDYIVMLDDHSQIHPSCVIGDKFEGKYKIIQIEKNIIDTFPRPIDYLNDARIFHIYILPELKEYMDYCLNVDMDEYLVIRKFKNINEVIDFYQPFDQLKINWLFFGNNNIKKNDDLCKLKPLFTKSGAKMENMVKSFVKVNSIITGGCSHTYNIDGINKNVLNNITPDYFPSDTNVWGLSFTEVNLYIAHYIAQDTYTFVKRRFGRYTAYYESVKNIEHLIVNIIEREKLVNYTNNNINDIVDYVHGDTNDINIFLDVYRDYIQFIKGFYTSHNKNETNNFDLSVSYFK